MLRRERKLWEWNAEVGFERWAYPTVEVTQVTPPETPPLLLLIFADFILSMSLILQYQWFDRRCRIVYCWVWLCFPYI
jgi:hypothetical protein